MPPTTRSMRTLSTLASATTAAVRPRASKTSHKAKRTIEDADPAEITSSPQLTKKARVAPFSTLDTDRLPSNEKNELLPATLSFSLEAAKKHLNDADARFEEVFSKLPCRPFEELEMVDPFRTLVTSILGQQISWLAARSITHRFIRLYYPSLPEKPPAAGSDEPKVPKDLFPTASQVANTDVTTLKSAGLSTRKAEYVLDLASRFADGRLSNQKLIEADDEELARLLIEVRGIGRWTVDMFAIFSLRRPDILPVGDLGVQRGVIRWFLSLHSPGDPVTISSKKLPKAPDSESQNKDVVPQEDVTLSSVLQRSEPSASLPSSSVVSKELDAASIPPAPVKGTATDSRPVGALSTSSSKAELNTGSMAQFPEPFTPSINRILYAKDPAGADNSANAGVQKKDPTPLPDGLTVASLKGRLNGKKIKGALLTPEEMQDLTESWRPYRSLGVYYMWALTEESPPKSSESSKSKRSN